MSNVPSVGEKDFEQEVLKSTVPVVVDMWAEWCGPCRVLGPLVDELAQELDGKVKFVKVNVDHEPEIARRYGIMSIPTLLFFRDGELVDQVVGLVPKNNLLAKISSALGVQTGQG
jgi:thioredoxin 1